MNPPVQIEDDEFEPDLGPDVPLQAGSGSDYMAVVLPDLLFVEYNRSREGMAALGNAGKLLAEALERHPDPTATSGQVFGSVPQWAKEFSAVEAHERDHVRRLISTSFGLLCHAFRTQQLVAARDLVVEAAHEPGGLRLPFNLLDQKTSLGTSAHQALTAARLQMALENRLNMADFRAAEPALAGWTVDGCEYVAAELPGDPTHSSLRITIDEVDLPRLKWLLKAKWLTTSHLLELFGACEEGNRLLGTGSGIEQVVDKLNQKDGRYNLPLYVWFSQFPTPPDRPRPAIRPPRSGELALSFYRTFPLELFVAADLALWPPFTPEGLASSHSELDWTDVSPAFRFARILLGYKKLGVTPGEWPDDDFNLVIPGLQQRVCELYGWPTPADLAAQWHDHLTSRANTWFPDPALGGFRHTTTLQLLALRRDRPGDIVVNNIDYQAAKVHRTAGWITQESDRLLTPLTLAPEADRQATEFWFHLHALTPALLATKGDRLGYLMNYPSDARRACIEAFDTWGAAANSWPSEDFRRAAAAFLKLG
jgi:hypothetical protein